jgi:hypothetical protein
VRLRRQRHPVALLDAHGGAEHAAVRGRRRVRAVLRAALRQLPVVQPGLAVRRGDGHQPLPAQLVPPERQRRVVQPAAAALRPGAALLPAARGAGGRHRPRAVPPRAVPALGRGPVLRAGQLLLAPAVRDERGRQRRRLRPRREEGRRAGLQLRARVAQLGHHAPGVRRARQRAGPRRQDDQLQRAAEDHRRRRRHPRLVVHWTLLPGIQQLLLSSSYLPSHPIYSCMYRHRSIDPRRWIILIIYSPFLDLNTFYLFILKKEQTFFCSTKQCSVCYYQFNTTISLSINLQVKGSVNNRDYVM